MESKIFDDRLRQSLPFNYFLFRKVKPFKFFGKRSVSAHYKASYDVGILTKPVSNILCNSNEEKHTL